MPLVSRYAFGLIALHAVLIPLGVLAEWPAQFDASSDPDAGAEWATRGTAVSAPLLPLALLGIGAWLARRRDGWGTFALVLLSLTATAMLIAGVGEALADADETPRLVLVVSGVVAALLFAGLVGLAVRDLLARRGARRSPA